MTIADSDLFTTWIDPRSGVASSILTRRVAPEQLSFYFVNAGDAVGGRFLWFYTCHPPSGNAGAGRTLAVADLHLGTVTHVPVTQFLDASPMVDPASGEVYWVSGLEIWKRLPDPDARPEFVAAFPAEIAGSRSLRRVATHLTMSASRMHLSMDAQIGARWYVGAVPLDGSPIEIWQEFDRCYNHAQFSPVDPDLQLIAQDWWHDPVTGERHDYEDRLWSIRRGDAARPVLPGDPSRRRSHEWWQADGSHIWYVDYELGTERVNIATGERTNVWPGGTCHSYCDRTGTYLAGDIGTYSWARTGCRVAFFNSATGREIDIASDLLEPEAGRARYHVDPHPRFCFDDQYIAYTTTVFGRADVALVPVADLVAATT